MGMKPGKRRSTSTYLGTYYLHIIHELSIYASRFLGVGEKGATIGWCYLSVRGAPKREKEKSGNKLGLATLRERGLSDKVSGSVTSSYVDSSSRIGIMDSILMFDDSPPPTDDIIDMMADASMESFLGLNDSFIFDVDNTTALDELLESYNDIDTADFGEMYPFNTSHLLPYPSLSTLGQKETTMFEFITVGIMLTMVSMFGLAGNIVAIIVLSSPVMRGSFSSLLIGKLFTLFISNST